jgi:hypothetical protein
MTIYDVGDSVRLDVDFTDLDGAAADPTAISLVIRNPKGVRATYTYAGGHVTRTGTGAYYYDTTANEPGTWHYKWTGTGALVVGEQGRFEVRRNAVAE